MLQRRTSLAGPAGVPAYRPARLFLFAALLLATLTGYGVAWGYLHTKGVLAIDWYGYLLPSVQRWQTGQPIYGAGSMNTPPMLLLVAAVRLAAGPAALPVWIALSAGGIVLAALLTARVLDMRLPALGWIALVWGLLVSVPVVMAVLVFAQTTGIVILGYGLGIWWCSRGRDLRGGAALALTVFKPQLGFLVLPMLLYQRRWTAAASYLAATAAALLLTYLVFGGRTFADYAHLLRELAGGTFSYDSMQIDVIGIHGMLLQQWPHSRLADLTAYALILALLAALARVWRHDRGTADPRRFARRWSMLILMTLLAAPLTHAYSSALLAIPSVALCAEALDESRALSERRWTVVALVLLYLTPLLRMLYRQHTMVPAMLLALVVLWRADGLPAWRWFNLRHALRPIKVRVAAIDVLRTQPLYLADRQGILKIQGRERGEEVQGA